MAGSEHGWGGAWLGPSMAGPQAERERALRMGHGGAPHTFGTVSTLRRRRAASSPAPGVTACVLPSSSPLACPSSASSPLASSWRPSRLDGLAAEWMIGWIVSRRLRSSGRGTSSMAASDTARTSAEMASTTERIGVPSTSLSICTSRSLLLAVAAAATVPAPAEIPLTGADRGRAAVAVDPGFAGDGTASLVAESRLEPRRGRRGTWRSRSRSAIGGPESSPSASSSRGRLPMEPLGVAVDAAEAVSVGTALGVVLDGFLLSLMCFGSTASSSSPSSYRTEHVPSAFCAVMTPGYHRVRPSNRARTRDPTPGAVFDGAGECVIAASNSTLGCLAKKVMRQQ